MSENLGTICTHTVEKDIELVLRCLNFCARRVIGDGFQTDTYIITIRFLFLKPNHVSKIYGMASGSDIWH